MYSQLTIKDCSSSRFRESTSITVHNGFTAHHDSLTTKMLDHGVSKKGSPHPLPLPCSNTAYWQIYLYVFLVSVCSSTYPGLRQNSSKVNSQGQASGRSLNWGSSIMAPASAQLTLTVAQEKEDNKSQEQAAKAEINSTGNKIWQNCLPAKNILTFFVCFKEIQLFIFFNPYYVFALVGAFSWAFRALLLLNTRSCKLPLILGVKCIPVKGPSTWGIIDGMWDKSPRLLNFFTLVQGAERDPGFSHTLFARSISVRVLEPGHLKEDYPITTFFENKRFSRFFPKGPITLKILRAASWEARSVQTRFNIKLFNGRIAKPWIWVFLSTKIGDLLFSKKRWDWIIFFQLTRFEKSHCKFAVWVLACNSPWWLNPTFTWVALLLTSKRLKANLFNRRTPLSWQISRAESKSKLAL